MRTIRKRLALPMNSAVVEEEGATTEPGVTGFSHDALAGAGKRVPWFPHPSGENGEYVKLANVPEPVSLRGLAVHDIRREAAQE